MRDRHPTRRPGRLAAFRNVQRHRVLGGAERRQRLPGLRTDGLRAAALYWDATMDDARLVLLYDGSVPVGGMFLIDHGDTVHLPWSSTRRRYHSQSANSVLHWEALKNCMERRARRFDFGRSQWGSSTFAFKEQWGASPRPLYYQYSLGRASHPPTIADQRGAFALAVRAWQRLPLSWARALGPIARRAFPEAL